MANVTDSDSQKTEAVAAIASENAYDNLPYESYPYPQTDIQNLYSIARFFDFDAVDFNKAKVLELGCASGGNLLPMAINYPNATFVGVDYSSKQIEVAKKHQEALKVENIEFKGDSILDIDASFGTFDYIIVHGILSWVPKNVQDKIFEICGANLSKQGIAYISYNTLPGWNAVRSIREMMQYHTTRFTNPMEKAQQARLLLEFINEANEGKASPYAQAIEGELSLLKDKPDSYLMHDHLEDNNEPFYFHDIANRAMSNDLQYLSDTSIASMYTGYLQPKVREVLDKVKDNILQTEQYLDFIGNRRFRSSLFCRQGTSINRGMEPDRIEPFMIRSQLQPTVAHAEAEKAIEKGEAVTFKTAAGVEYKTASLIDYTIVQTLAEAAPALMSVKKLADVIEKKFKDKAESAQLRGHTFTCVIQLILASAISLKWEDEKCVTKVSDKPQASTLAAYQAQSQDWVTSQRGDKINLDVFSRVLIQYVNGKNSLDELKKEMLTHLEKGDLSLMEDGKKIEDKKAIDKRVTEIVKGNLQQLAALGILIA